MTLTPPWMTTLDSDDPDYSYKKAIQDFCINAQNEPDYLKLDLLIYSEYGDRPVSPFITLLLGESEYLDDARRQIVASQLFYQLQESWLRLFNTMSTSYSPLDNYSMKESGTDTDHDQTLGFRNDKNKDTKVKATGTPDSTTQFPELEDGSAAYSVTTANKVSAKSKNSIATFDGTDTKLVSTNETEAPVNSAQNEATTTPTGVQSNAAHSWGYKNHSHSFQRAGNIGVTTSTQMLEADANYWSANDFFNIVASQIASVITSPYYE